MFKNFMRAGFAGVMWAADTGAAGGTEPAASTAPVGDAAPVEVFDQARALQTIQHLRDIEKQLNKKLKEQETAHEREKLSAEDKLRAELADAQKRADAAEKAAQAAALRSKILGKAGKLGFADPDDAWRLIDPDSVSDDTLEGQLAELLSKKPYLGRPAAAPATGTADAQRAVPKISAGNPAAPGGLTIEQIRRMSPEDIERNRDAVLQVLKNNP